MSRACADCEARRALPPGDAARAARFDLPEVAGPIAGQVPWVKRTLHRCACGALWELGCEQHHFRDEEVVWLWERDEEYARVLYETDPDFEALKRLFARLDEDIDRIRLWTVLSYKARADREGLRALGADAAAPPLLRRTAKQVEEALARDEL